MGSGYAKQKKEAQRLREEMEKIQKERACTEVTGTAGGGIVTVTLSGNGDLKKVHLSPECVDREDVEGLEDLILLAFREAQQKLAVLHQDTLGGFSSVFR